MAEVAHANKSDDGADQRQPLDAFSDLGISFEAEVSGEANEPHCSTAPKANGKPAHKGVPRSARPRLELVSAIE